MVNESGKVGRKPAAHTQRDLHDNIRMSSRITLKSGSKHTMVGEELDHRQGTRRIWMGFRVGK